MTLLAQSPVPVGIDPRSSLTWVVAGALLVTIMLVFSTRRASTRPRSGFTPPPRTRERPAAPVAAPNASIAKPLSTARETFVDDPRASVEGLQAAVVRVLASRSDVDTALLARYREAAATTADPAATTDDLRAALRAFAEVLEALEQR